MMQKVSEPDQERQALHVSLKSGFCHLQTRYVCFNCNTLSEYGTIWDNKGQYGSAQEASIEYRVKNE